MPEREGILRAIDGQHRLLALHADIDRFGDEPFTVPAIIFDRVPEDHIVQMFVTINAKHTRLNASHLVSLSGRQLYRDEALAAAHDVVRALNDREESPLHGEIKLLGVGKGRVARRRSRRSSRGCSPTRSARRRAQGRGVPRGVEEVLRQLLQADRELFESAWNGRKYSIKSATALRAFIRVAPDVDPEDRSAARRSHRLPRDRPRHLAVGPPHRRAALRDRRRVEASGHDGRQPDEGTAPRAAVSGRRRRIETFARARH